MCVCVCVWDVCMCAYVYVCSVDESGSGNIAFIDSKYVGHHVTRRYPPPPATLKASVSASARAKQNCPFGCPAVSSALFGRVLCDGHKFSYVIMWKYNNFMNFLIMEKVCNAQFTSDVPPVRPLKRCTSCCHSHKYNWATTITAARLILNL